MPMNWKVGFYSFPKTCTHANVFLSCQAQAIINGHLEHRRQERVEDPRK